VLVLAHPGPVVASVSLVALTLGALLTAFCVQHDANHGAYFRRRSLNHLLGWSADTMLGYSSYAWR
jgi:fatty acid desaturase